MDDLDQLVNDPQDGDNGTGGATEGGAASPPGDTQPSESTREVSDQTTGPKRLVEEWLDEFDTESAPSPTSPTPAAAQPPPDPPSPAGAAAAPLPKDLVDEILDQIAEYEKDDWDEMSARAQEAIKQGKPVYKIKLPGGEKTVTAPDLVTLAQRGASVSQKHQQIVEEGKMLRPWAEVAKNAAENEVPPRHFVAMANSSARQAAIIDQAIKSNMPPDPWAIMQESYRTLRALGFNVPDPPPPEYYVRLILDRFGGQGSQAAPAQGAPQPQAMTQGGQQGVLMQAFGDELAPLFQGQQETRQAISQIAQHLQQSQRQQQEQQQTMWRQHVVQGVTTAVEAVARSVPGMTDAIRGRLKKHLLGQIDARAMSPEEAADPKRALTHLSIVEPNLYNSLIHKKISARQNKAMQASSPSSGVASNGNNKSKPWKTMAETMMEEMEALGTTG